MSLRSVVVLLLAGVAAVAVAAPAAQAGSLPEVASGARPGPDLLYAPAADAPQLQNTGPWKAAPILVSGAEAYRDGELLYQDFLYDDHGATGTPDPSDPFTSAENLFSPKHGTLTYPTGPAYANNAADLVEVRVKPLADATAFRVTLNTLKDPERTAVTFAIGGSAEVVPWPHGAGVVSPAELFLTVHGATAELRDAVTGTVRPGATASVDLARRQLDVRVPHSAWDPGTSTVRLAAGAGVWDPATGAYATPGPVASATQPGGVAKSGAALFNMAFRFGEPLPKISNPGVANTIAEGGVGVALDGAWWRERQQGDVLATGDVSPFSTQVDFAKLAAGTNDDSGVPKTGHIDRILASRYDLGQGVDYTVKCISSLLSQGAECTGRQLGRLQPYALYVPRKAPPARGFGLTLSMHGLSANYNEFLGSNEAVQLGERGPGSIIASPEGRGPDGSYQSYAEADVFEMWADVARHYTLDQAFTAVSGYSMGGLGTYRLATRFPDLFARAFPIVGPASGGGYDTRFASLRNVPVMAWYGQTDELVGPEMSEPIQSALAAAKVRYEHWVFAPAGHITIGNNDEFSPAARFLGDHRVDRDPPHVTYVVAPATDYKSSGVADHAYWLSALKVRGTAEGTIDARSSGFGLGDAPVLATFADAGTLDGGSHGSLPYTRRGRAWGPEPAAAKANRLDLRTTGLSAATIDVARARVGCDVDLHVTSDAPLKVTLAGCDQVLAVVKGTSRAGCVSRRRFPIHLPARIRGRRVVSSRVTVRGKRVRVVRRRATVDLRGVVKGRVTVKIVHRLRGGRRVTQTRRYRTCG